MAENDDRTESASETIDRIRAVMAAGFAFVRGQEVTSSIAVMSFEEMLQEAIRDISEDESPIRLGKLATIRQLRNDITVVVDEALRLPDDAFATTAGSGAANTREEEDD